jgi:catechol 2,3-dioxygenase-like lactoylglutathione lyase family enzyme
MIQLDHVLIACPRGSEAEARSFYGDLLGLDEIEKPEPLRLRGGCWFNVGAHQLHLGVEDPFTPAKKAHPAFGVDDCARLFEMITAMGYGCRWDYELPGVIRFYSDDPWGNRLEFIQLTEPPALA